MGKGEFAQGFLALWTISTIHVLSGLAVSPDALGVGLAAMCIEQAVALPQSEV
jgi:hypothetical protein